MLYYVMHWQAELRTDHGPEKKEISIIYAGASSAHKLHTARDGASSSSSSCSFLCSFFCLCCCCWRATSYYNSNLCSLQTLFTRTFLSTPYDWVSRPVLRCSPPSFPPLRGANETCFCHSPLKLASCRTKEAEMKPNGTSKTNLQNENATHTRNEGRKGEKE